MDIYLVICGNQPLIVLDPEYDCHMDKVEVISRCLNANGQYQPAYPMVKFAAAEILRTAQAEEMLPDKLETFTKMADRFEASVPAFLLIRWGLDRSTAWDTLTQNIEVVSKIL